MYKSPDGEVPAVPLFYASDNAVAHSDFRAAVDNISGNFRYIALTAEFLISKQLPPKGAVIFVDLNHSSFTGYQIIQFLKKSKLYTKVPIIVLAKDNDYRTQETCWELGSDLYTIQPDSMSEFALLLETLANLDWPARRVRNKKEFLFCLRNRITA